MDTDYQAMIQAAAEQQCKIVPSWDVGFSRRTGLHEFQKENAKLCSNDDFLSIMAFFGGGTEDRVARIKSSLVLKCLYIEVLEIPVSFTSISIPVALNPFS